MIHTRTRMSATRRTGSLACPAAAYNTRRPGTGKAACPTGRRPGFTLIEMLVVISIIAVLATLVVGGVMWATRGQQQSNTEDMMRTVHKALEAHWAQVVNDAKKEVGIPTAVLALADNNVQRARIIWIKLRLMEAFPTSYDEIRNFYPYSAGWIPDKRKYIGSYDAALTAAGITVTTPTGPTESAACLLLALSVNRGGNTLNPDSLGSFVQDTNNDRIKELVDGWNNALTFYRFPTDNSELQGLSPSTTKYKDSQDPTGTLLSWSGANNGTFIDKVHKTKFGSSNDACYVVPTLVSSGPNKNLGLDTFMNVNNPNDADDNIMSFRLKVGARGD